MSGSVKIPHVYCGDLVGNGGEIGVQCFGYLKHKGVLVYLNMAGANTGVMGIHAQIVGTNMAVKLASMDRKHVVLDADKLDGDKSAYFSARKALPKARKSNCILWHKHFEMPAGKTTEDSFMFLMSKGEDVLRAKVANVMFKSVNMPIFDEWQSTIFDAGRDAGLIYPIHPDEGVMTPDIWAMKIHAQLWEDLIISQLKAKYITF